jgi:hypothetical protein
MAIDNSLCIATSRFAVPESASVDEVHMKELLALFPVIQNAVRCSTAQAVSSSKSSGMALP